ncbi:MAG: hypothetical protein ACTSXZ_03300, partial [Alphaproteobacteria bacterium]
FLRGEYDRIHYYPNRTLAQDLALSDWVARRTDPQAIVFSEAGQEIKRRSPHKLVKAGVLLHYAHFETEMTRPGCQVLARFMPGACDAAYTPGQRMLEVLLANEPALIVFSYPIGRIFSQHPETRGWFLDRYAVWFDPQTMAFVGLPKGQNWEK